MIKKHWSIRYVYNRINYYFFEKRNQDKPWLTQESINQLGGLLQKGDIGLEFGSGRSTKWYAEQIGHLTSVEDNREWYEMISAKLSQTKTANVNYLFKSAEGSIEGETAYVKVIEGYDDNSLDFIVVDGKHRGIIALLSIDKLKKGGLLLIDDVNRYLPSNTYSPHSLGPYPENMEVNWKKFYQLTNNTWRVLWTSNGVKDTAIYIKR